jgi:hypothetical protein
MTLNHQFFAVPLISFEEFEKRVVEHLLENYKNYELNYVFESFIKDGCPKLNKDDIGAFMKGIGAWRLYFFDPVAVDIGDGMFYWLVSGGEAILVKYKR